MEKLWLKRNYVKGRSSNITIPDAGALLQITKPANLRESVSKEAILTKWPGVQYKKIQKWVCLKLVLPPKSTSSYCIFSALPTCNGIADVFLPHNCCITSCILLYPLIGSIVEVEIEFCHINIFNSPTQQTNIRIFFQDYKPIAAFNKHLLQILKGFKWLIYDNPKW